MYDRLGVGPASFGRAVAVSGAGSYAAGALWIVAYHYYRQVGAGIIHSVVVGAPSSIHLRRGWILDGALVNGALAGETGMNLLPRLGVDVDVVFVTAYDRYTLRAFEVNALDYLLKPVAPERLAVTVSRLGAAQPPAPPRGTVTYQDRLFLRLGRERAFVRVRDIVVIEAEGDGSALRLAPRLARKPSAESLREWERRLPDRQFVRIHRSTIVNLEYVERLESWSPARLHLYLRALPEPMTMSRRFGARFRDRLG